MTTVNKYRVRCLTDNKYEEVWAEQEPTVCPINTVHTIDTTLTTIIDTVKEDLPLSDLEGQPLAVHPSYKPQIFGSTTYAVWTGSGDDVISNPNVIGEGDLLHFNMITGTATEIKDIKFSPDFGRVWIHEAYLKFTNGGDGDHIEADVVATATILQTAANLDLELSGDFIKGSAGGPGTGTHGWAASPVLIPRTFSNDGDWDYDGVTLTPNNTGTGGFNIKIVDTVIHRYVNKIPTQGNCPYFSMSSDETTELLLGYYLRVKCHNVSNTNWEASVIAEIYRERTI